MSCEGGGVLLEVLMALALVVGAFSVITGGLQSAVDSVERMRNSVHGQNLAVSLLSQIQMGLVDAEDVEGVNFEAPFGEWAYDIETEEVETETIGFNSGNARPVPEMLKVEVAIHRPDGQVIHRMGQFIFMEPSE
jgi:type II secretory pathway pseudopilin PulG